MQHRMNRSLYTVILLALCSISLLAQEATENKQHTSALLFSIETMGSAYSSNAAAFWSVHGKGGRRSLEPKSALVDLMTSYSYSINNKHHLSATLEGIIETGLKPVYRIRQLGISYQNNWIGAQIGALDYHNPITYSPQSSGTMVLSNNALPIPMVMLHTNSFIDIPWTKGFASFYADFSVGRFFENRYNQLTYPNATNGAYTLGTLWHHKTGYLRVGKPDAAIPLTFTLGGTHAAHWGGKHIGKESAEPTSFKDFMRIVMGKSGGNDATISDQINVLGNHYGQYLFELAWHTPKSIWQLYHLRIFEDKSGIEMSNGADGLWGFHLTFTDNKPISHFVVEYITTMHQSGPFHILEFERPNGEGRGGGGDNYYFNSEYRSGATYLGMNIGNPLILPRGYTPYLSEDARRYRHNRIQALHFGIGGLIKQLWNIQYETKLTFVKSWGSFGTRPEHPFQSTFSYLKLHAPIQSVKGLSIGLEGALDVGSFTPQSFGGGVSVKYEFRHH